MRTPLGLDTYSLRAQNWTPFQQLDFCAANGVEVAHFSEPRLLGGLDRRHLGEVRAYADARGVALEVGMLSICPTSGIFDPSAGAADEQLARMIDAAVLLGSPLVRCVVGNALDRRTPGGITPHMDAALNVLRRVRSRATDAGVKIAVENHSGDMQARELRMLVEAAGTDLAGVCIDSGNASWAVEDPHLTLETLAPYVLTSHMRDSAVWNSPDGAVAQWTLMGEGNVDLEQYIRSYVERCPGRAVSLELIMHRQRIFDYREPEFWSAYRDTPAWEFARFLSRAERGAPRPPVDPNGTEQIADVEASLRWIAGVLAKCRQDQKAGG